MSREINVGGAKRVYYLHATHRDTSVFATVNRGKKAGAPRVEVKVKNGIRVGRETVLLAAAQGTRWIKLGAIS